MEPIGLNECGVVALFGSSLVGVQRDPDGGLGWVLARRTDTVSAWSLALLVVQFLADLRVIEEGVLLPTKLHHSLILTIKERREADFMVLVFANSLCNLVFLCAVCLMSGVRGLKGESGFSASMVSSQSLLVLLWMSLTFSTFVGYFSRAWCISDSLDC